jgi:Glutamate/Leucine/Phenylalanine/Valine dehydrogenase
MNHPSRCEHQLSGHWHAGPLLFASPLSSDKAIAVIDGSGVLADPAGINREELVRLAKLQVPVEHFDNSKLSKDGYLVRIEDQDVKLPCMSSCDQSWVVNDAFCFSQP